MTVRERNIVKVLRAKLNIFLMQARKEEKKASTFASNYYAEVTGLESAIRLIESDKLEQLAKYYKVKLENESDDVAE